MKTKFFNIFALLKQFRQDNSGAVAILYGPTLLVLLLAAGLAIDYARAYIVKKEISRAIDASILAAGSMANADEDAMRETAERYFMANLSDEIKKEYNPQLNFDLDPASGEITASSTANVDTFLMRLAGHDHVDVAAEAVAGRTLVNVEVAFVLDNSGSMSGSKIASLKSAAKKLVETLYQTEGSTDFVRFSLVPFTGAVNVGIDHYDADWIDSDGDSLASQEDFGSDYKYWEMYDPQSGQSVENQYRGMTAKEALESFNANWRGCVRSRVGTATNEYGVTVDYDLWDVAADDNEPNSLFPLLVRPIHTVFSEVITNSNQIPSNAAVKRALDRLSYFRLSDTCPVADIMTLSNNQSEIESQIDAMVASGWTNITEGLMWGWRVLSPGEPFTQGDEYDNSNVRKVIVVLTDGQNNVGNYYSDKRQGWTSSYGMTAFGHLGNGGWPASTLNTKLADACTNVKSKGILIYSITFQLNDTTTQNLMRDCATQNDMYFNSPSNDALEDAFEQIAAGLQKLILKK